MTLLRLERNFTTVYRVCQ